MKKFELLKLSLINSAGVLIYVFLVALFMRNAAKIVGQVDTIFSGVAFLLLFVSSAAITGGLVLGRPILFYLDGRKKEAVKLFVLTIAWLFILTIIALAISYFLR